MEFFNGEYNTTPYSGNLHQSGEIGVHGPRKENAEYVNITWKHPGITLHHTDARWLRDRLIERFPLDMDKEDVYSELKWLFTLRSNMVENEDAAFDMIDVKIKEVLEKL